MPGWIETKQEIERRGSDYDGVRRERIREVERITGRPLVIYATAFLQTDKVAVVAGEVGIDNYDPIGFDEVIGPIEGDSLDVLLHSPGGSAEAAESIISLLRSRYSSLRFIVPHMAKSAATMICCAGDEILMDERSELGPIDPQMRLRRGDGQQIQAPAQAILKQFDKAQESLAANPKQMSAWLPLLQPLSPSLLMECEAANELAHRLVEDWLRRYMFKGKEDGPARAAVVAKYLANSGEHLSHGRRVGIEQLQAKGVNAIDLRQTPDLRNAVWNLYQAISWTLQDTGAFKIIESSRNTAFIRQVIIQQIPPPGSVILPSPAPQPQQPQRHPPPPQKSQQRRTKKRR